MEGSNHYCTSVSMMKKLLFIIGGISALAILSYSGSDHLWPSLRKSPPTIAPAQVTRQTQAKRIKTKNLTTTGSQHQGNVMIAKTDSGDQRVLVLDRSGKTLEFPFNDYFVELTVKTGPDISSVIIDGSRTRKRKFTLALGSNPLNVVLIEKNGGNRRVISIKMMRSKRTIKFDAGSKIHVCYLEQDCGVILFPSRDCGVQEMKRWTPSEEVQGYWRLKCNNCSQELTCLWANAEWVEKNGEVTPPTLPDGNKLRMCFKDRQLLFLGDSVLSGMMHSMMEKMNKTLNRIRPAPMTSVNFIDVGLGTNVSLIYYNPNIPSQKTSFDFNLEILHQQFLLRGQEKKTLLIIGGTRWVTASLLAETKHFLTRVKIPKNNVFIKLYSSGFHVPSEFTEQMRLTPMQFMMEQNAKVKKLAVEYGFGVVDHLQLTLSRYREFHHGACGCHFASLRRLETFSEGSPQPLKHYHATGEINTVYTHMLLKKMCP